MKNSRKLRNSKNKTRKMKGGAKIPLAEGFCSSGHNMPSDPKKSLIASTAPFPKPWLDVGSNILFIALVIKEDSHIGNIISSIAADVEQTAFIPYASGPFRNPHMSLLNIYIPENFSSESLHMIFSKKTTFNDSAIRIADLVNKHIISYHNVLFSNSDKYEQFGKFIVKKYDDDSTGRYSYFIDNNYRPFKEELCNLLGSLIDKTNTSFHINKCYPAYMPSGRIAPLFTHYRIFNNNVENSSDFAIISYFEDDYRPHLSLVDYTKINDETYLPRLKRWDKIQFHYITQYLNMIHLYTTNISSIYISYGYNYKIIDL